MASAAILIGACRRVERFIRDTTSTLASWMGRYYTPAHGSPGAARSRFGIDEQVQLAIGSPTEHESLAANIAKSLV